MATCSLVGFLFFPRAFRKALMVAATPPPGETTPRLQSIPSGGAGEADAALAVATWRGLNIFGIVFDLRAVCIATRN